VSAPVDILVTGALGQLGRAVGRVARARGKTLHGIDLPAGDFTDPAVVEAACAEHPPAWIFHCGALTNVDGCEQDPELASKVNGQGTANVVEAARRHGAGLIYISTDFVFDGAATEPYVEDHPVAPISVYGASKAEGEKAVLAAGDPRFYVLRTSWVFGPGGKNFPKAILGRAREGHPLTVVDDQIGRPTYTDDLAEAMFDVMESGAPGGIYHASNDGQCSWHGFACDLVAAAGLDDVEVATMSSDQLDRPARRPAWSVLDCSKLAAVRGRNFPHYKDAITRYLASEAAEEQGQ